MTEKELIFREVNKNDIDELCILLNKLSEKSKQFFRPHPFDKKSLKTIHSSGKDHYFVMIYKNKIIGYSFLRLFGYEIPSYGGCIHQKYQGKGFGKKLTEWTVDKSRELGYKKVILKVYKDNNAAFNMYKKEGFKVTNDLKETNEWKMEKKFQ